MATGQIAPSLFHTRITNNEAPDPVGLSMPVNLFTTKKIAFPALAAGLITFLVYLRALNCGFVLWDDPEYILYNTAIRHLDLNLLISAFTRPTAGFWLPLTTISFAIDYHFWELNPFGYHLTNILLHSLNATLVVLIADRLCRDRFTQLFPSSVRNHLYPGMLFMAGLLFAIHPLRVESVAWVTERKDVLNGVFSLGCILSYLHFARLREGTHKGSTAAAYILSLILFILSLMAKPVSVVIPAMLLVIDWYPLQRLRHGRVFAILAEKVPFVLIAAAMTFATIQIAAGSNIIFSASELSYPMRAVVAGNGLFEYGRLMLWPVGILPFYLLPKSIPYIFVIKMAIAAAISCACIYPCRKRPWITATWLAFILPLLPVLGFTQNGEQAFAARFTYLPALFPGIVAAVLLTVAYGKISATTNRAVRQAFLTAIVALFVFYGGMTLRLIGVWQDTGTLWSRVIEIQPLGRAYKDRGLYYLTIGKDLAAIEDLSKAIDSATRAGLQDVYNIYAFRGKALANLGRYEEALNDFNTAISSSPRPKYYYHRGLALQAAGRVQEAEEDFKRAGTGHGALDWQIAD